MITDTLQNELRERYNPNGSTLRKQQLRMLEMLQYIDSVCKKHNIRYWLCSGTLLGAVRHGGFIPWDDDVDIEMLREDYKRLIKVLHEEPSSHYAVQTCQSDSDYTLPFGKLRDLHSHVIERGVTKCRYDGCWIDLFYLEKNTYSCLKLSVGLQKFFLASTGTLKGRPKFLLSFYKALLHNFSFPILRFINKLFPLKYLYHTYGVAFYKNRRPEDIFPLGEIEFEGIKFSAPVDVNSYLQRIYGDYMKLPSIDKIKTHELEIKFEEK
ncbi:phosphorylcholine transferase LicD [Bacteroides fluxus]|uniref:LicD family protein n=1 Tax=Bacteroides fluxus TaxID=626930 RepID=UPI0023A82734|nr:LicD family protein [Bacteroides fluxus]